MSEMPGHPVCHCLAVVFKQLGMISEGDIYLFYHVFIGKAEKFSEK